MIKNYIANQVKEIEKEFYNIKLKDILCFKDGETIAEFMIVSKNKKYLRTVTFEEKETLFNIAENDIREEDQCHIRFYEEGSNRKKVTRTLSFLRQGYNSLSLNYQVYKTKEDYLHCYFLVSCCELESAEIMLKTISFHKNKKQYIEFGATSFLVQHYMTPDKSQFVTMIVPNSKQVFWEGIEYDVKDDGIGKLDDLLSATEEKKKLDLELNSQEQYQSKTIKRKRL